MGLLTNQTMLRLLTDAYDYMEYDQSRAKALIRRCIYLLEDTVYTNGKEDEEGEATDY